MWQVFVDRKGRTIDLAQCLIQANSVLLLVSPSRRKPLLTRLDQYIFYGDKVPHLSGLSPSKTHAPCTAICQILPAFYAYLQSMTQHFCLAARPPITQA